MKIDCVLIKDRAIALWSKGIRPLTGIAATAPWLQLLAHRMGELPRGIGDSTLLLGWAAPTPSRRPNWGP